MEGKSAEAAAVPKYQSSAIERKQPMSINFYAPVGVLQVGDSNIASVTQQWTQESRKDLIAALRAIEDAIRSQEMSVTVSKDDLLARVKDAKDETCKEKPDASRMRTLLSGIGATIRTAGSMPGVYQVLKAAAKALGIDLP